MFRKLILGLFVVAATVFQDYLPPIMSGGKKITSGYVAAASRDRVVYVDETPGRATSGWFHRQP